MTPPKSFEERLKEAALKHYPDILVESGCAYDEPYLERHISRAAFEVGANWARQDCRYEIINLEGQKLGHLALIGELERQLDLANKRTEKFKEL